MEPWVKVPFSPGNPNYKSTGVREFTQDQKQNKKKKNTRGCITAFIIEKYTETNYLNKKDSLTVDFSGVDVRGIIWNPISWNIHLKVLGKQGGISLHS